METQVTARGRRQPQGCHRIGGAQRFIGAALNLKPILAIKDGRVEGIERIRTKARRMTACSNWFWK